MYVMQIERLERRVLTLQQAAVIASGMGARVTVPELDEERARFDAALIAPPEPDTPTRALLRALEVA